jgi:hypothetical protein
VDGAKVGIVEGTVLGEVEDATEGEVEVPRDGAGDRDGAIEGALRGHPDSAALLLANVLEGKLKVSPATQLRLGFEAKAKLPMCVRAEGWAKVTVARAGTDWKAPSPRDTTDSGMRTTERLVR